LTIRRYIAETIKKTSVFDLAGVGSGDSLRRGIVPRSHLPINHLSAGFGELNHAFDHNDLESDLATEAEFMIRFLLSLISPA
jgi:hypothetical protein